MFYLTKIIGKLYMKISSIMLAVFLCFSSLSVNACPKGEHPYGGTGPHHKGGWCAR